MWHVARYAAHWTLFLLIPRVWQGSVQALILIPVAHYRLITMVTEANK